LCVLLWAHDGQEDLFAEYEDAALKIAVAHGGQVVSRLRRIDSPESPFEVQILRFPSQVTFQTFMDDPLRLAMSEQRDRAVAKTEVIRVDEISR